MRKVDLATCVYCGCSVKEKNRLSHQTQACPKRPTQTAQQPTQSPERFQENEGGTVSDTTTKLIWAKSDYGATITFDDAVEYCEQGGWRMPSSSEMQELYNLGLRADTPGITKINLTNSPIWISDRPTDHRTVALKSENAGWALTGYVHFGILGRTQFWRRRKSPEPAALALVFDFSEAGVVRLYPANRRGGTALRVRDMIRAYPSSANPPLVPQPSELSVESSLTPLTITGPPPQKQLLRLPPERFVTNADGTVSDTQERLVWEAIDNKADINYNNAVAYCIKDGWRMPTKEELLGLYDAGLRKETPGELNIWLTGDEVWAVNILKWNDAPQNKNSKKLAFNVSFAHGKSRQDPRTDSFLKRALRVRNSK